MNIDLYGKKFIGSPEAIAQSIMAAGFKVIEEKRDWHRYDKSIQCSKPELHHPNGPRGGITPVCECQKISGTTVTHTIKVGDATEIDELFEEFDRVKDEYRKTHGRTSNLLCEYQRRAYSRGWTPLSFSSNLYGWCYGSHLRSNIGGGRFSMTTRGLSMEEAMSQACQHTTGRKNTVLTLTSAGLPKKTLDILGIPAPRTEDNRWQERFGGASDNTHITQQEELYEEYEVGLDG